MSEVWLRPKFEHLQVMVGWKTSCAKFYVETEIYSSPLSQKPRAKLLDKRYFEHEDLTYVLHIAAAYAKIPNGLYEFLCKAADTEPQTALPLKQASGD